MNAPENFTGDFRFTGEGQTWTKPQNLKLTGSSNTLIRSESEPAMSFTYKRCARLDHRCATGNCAALRSARGRAMTQFDLTDDQRQIQEMAQKFTADAITPFAAEWDEKHIFPRDTIREAAELGFGAIYVAEELGGIGLGRLEAALIMEAMAYGCPSTSAFISIHNMASWMIDRFGSAELKAKYLPDLIPMKRMASYCLTEPSSGSDAAALKTKAVKDGDDYIVSGSKAFISGGGENEIYVAMVRTGEDGPKGISCLVIEKDMKGVSFGANEKKLGWHSQPTTQVNFDEVRVPASQPRRRRRRRFPHRDDGPRRRPPQHRRLLLGRRPALPRRIDRLHQGAQAVRHTPSPISRRPSSRSPTWKPSFRRRGCCSMSPPPRSRTTRPTRPGSRRWPSASPPTAGRRWSTARSSSTAATAISRIIRSSASGATCASIRSSKAPTRSCA